MRLTSIHRPSRIFGSTDLESILELVKKVRPSGQLNDYPGPVNLLELFQSPEPQETRVYGSMGTT